MSQSHLPLLIYGKYHWFTGFVSQVLKTTQWSQLKRAHIIILGGIYSGETRSIRLAEMVGVSRQAVSKTVRELEEFGLIAQSSDSKKGNSSVLLLTQDGHACIEAVNTEVDLLMDGLSKKFGKQALKNAIDIMNADWGEILRK